jgi:heterodisulfide reductase subunit C
MTGAAKRLPGPEVRFDIETQANSNSFMCVNCSSCDVVCPVNVGSNRLWPQKIVRLANLGLIDELITAREIWYCLRCRKCETVCPMQVKHGNIISFARAEIFRRHLISVSAIEQLRKIFYEFQYVRWHLADSCIQRKKVEATHQQWAYWADLPARSIADEIKHQPMPKGTGVFRNFFAPANLSTCQTCSECTNACPIFVDRAVFDPQLIIRMINLGFIDAALRSPSIWLCIGCQQCADACNQLVKPYLAIEWLKQMAENKGVVPFGFAHRFEIAEKSFYNLYLDKIDDILGNSFNIQ